MQSPNIYHNIQTTMIYIAYTNTQPSYRTLDLSPLFMYWDWEGLGFIFCIIFSSRHEGQWVPVSLTQGGSVQLWPWGRYTYWFRNCLLRYSTGMAMWLTTVLPLLCPGNGYSHSFGSYLPSVKVTVSCLFVDYLHQVLVWPLQLHVSLSCNWNWNYSQSGCLFLYKANTLSWI